MKLRSVNTEIWTDEWFCEKLTPVQKLVWLNIITNEKSNLLGIFEVSMRRIQFETGIELDLIKEALMLFKNDNKIAFVGPKIILKNHLKNNNYNLNMKKSVIASFNDLPETIRGDKILHKDDTEHSMLLIKKHIEKFFNKKVNGSEGFGTVRRYEEEDEDEYEEEREASIFSKFLKIFMEFYEKINPKFPYKENDREDAPMQEIINYMLKITEGDVAKSLELWQITLDSYEMWDNFHKKQLTITEINRNLPNILNKLTDVKRNSEDKSGIAENFAALYRFAERCQFN